MTPIPAVAEPLASSTSTTATAFIVVVVVVVVVINVGRHGLKKGFFNNDGPGPSP